jgi:uncharacterized membrane protein YkvA (DUF1232 family)
MKKEFSEKELNSQITKFTKKYKKNQDKNKKKINEKFDEKASKVSGSKKFFSNLKLLYKYFRDPKTPKGPKILIGAALLYFITPIDLIPDFIPVIGLLDDAAVIAYVVYKLKDELEEYKNS